MTHAGYRWTVSETSSGWSWALHDPSGGTAILRGLASTRAVAAAMVIRAIVRGMTEPTTIERAAA